MFINYLFSCQHIANTYLDASLTSALRVNTLAMIVLACCTSLFGHLADKFSYKLVMSTSTTLLAILGYPLYWNMLEQHSIQALLIAQITFSILGGGFVGPALGVMIHLFLIQTRYTALSISYNLGFGIFGGSVALLNMYVIETHRWLHYWL